jgi:ABC-type nitrate/sulfonate/bicarbonate transport system substrate-binding protein
MNKTFFPTSVSLLKDIAGRARDEFRFSPRRPRRARSLRNYFSEAFVSFVLSFVVNNPLPTFVFFAVNFLVPASLHAQELLRAGTIFSATQAPLWAAKEGHYFEKYGIKNLEIIQFSGGQPVTRALIGGDIQISTTGGAAVVNARLKGADTMIIARTVGVFPYTLFVGKDIRDAADLRGRKLAVSTVGGSGYVAMQYALRKLGLDPDKDVAMLQVGDFGTRLAALAAGTVQGRCCFRRSRCGRAS